MSTAMAVEDPDWGAHALAEIERLVEVGGRFTADDVREAVGEPHHPNQWGRIFTRAKELGLIVQVGWTRSRRRERHGSVLGIWTPNPRRQQTAFRYPRAA